MRAEKSDGPTLRPDLRVVAPESLPGPSSPLHWDTWSDCCTFRPTALALETESPPPRAGGSASSRPPAKVIGRAQCVTHNGQLGQAVRPRTPHPVGGA